MRHNPPAFDNYEQGPDFERARTQIATPFQYFDIDLSVAAANQIIQIAGDFLYFDTATGYDGILTFELNNEHSAPMAPFTGRAGFAINAQFKQIKASWTAQPGKKVRLMYSTGERVIPVLTGTLNITGTVTTLEDGFSYGASYKSSTALAANTPDVIVAPGTNVNGIIVYKYDFVTFNGSGIRSSLIAKASAPASNIDGDVIASENAFDSGGTIGIRMEKTVKIAAGKGLYRISNAAESQTLSSCLYTVL